ncbi:CHAT domain-containing protein [Nocardia aurantiaca]|uniref:CHAT domain-containing protein n=1 Tax=Nocardia aurantiaca TaxID=2675850 RepID=A0A6I3KV94_9NOCA|nr:CHAT domain-containing protein [Nocardia aurantiaca]MTE12460.1 CHAT domain-containing protein [Nocardia aurantiaca]
MTPTAYIRMADAGDLYLTWRWADESAPGGVGVVPEEQVEAAMRRFAAALPAPGVPGGLDAALATGELASYEAENELAQYLSSTFLPYNLAVRLHELYVEGVRPHLRIQPSPRTAQLPWELIAPDPNVRLVEIADVSVLAPPGIVHAPARVARSWAETRTLPVVAILDPRVPGFRADSSLGSVLGRMDSGAPLAALVAAHAAADRLIPAVGAPLEAFRRTDLDRSWLSRALHAGAARLLYVGHVTAAAPESGRSESATLHLSCTAASPGCAPAYRDHRPLSARDLLLGAHALAEGATHDYVGNGQGDSRTPHTGPEIWPIPSRVALIACESGGDLRFAEPLGLVAAMLTGGAELVTAGRWPLPTDLAFHRFAGTPVTTHPFQEAVCAIDTAHESSDPAAALNAWQREHLAAWRGTGEIHHSPLVWAAFATIDTR